MVPGESLLSAKPAVFVSYTEADETWAEWISWQLREDGWVVHLQVWHSVPGTDFVDWMQEKLASSDYVLAVLSNAYLSSRWGQAEWTAGYEPDQRRVIPVRVEECEPPALLAHLVRIDLFGLAEDEARRVLLRGTRAVRDGPAEPDEEPSFPVPRGVDQPPPAEAPPFPGWAAPRALFDRVARACRDRYPGVVIRPMPDASPVPYLVLDGDREGERQCWPVGVIAHGLDDSTVTAFHTSVHMDYESPGDAVESELVYAGVLVEPGLVRRARRLGVQVRSLPEFEGRWDPRSYLVRQSKKMANDPIYPPELYVPQRFVLLHEPPGTPVRNDVYRAIVDCLDVDAARFLLVLGDFGHGKTFLLHELARRLPAELPHLVPMLVELRMLEKTHSVDDLLTLHLSKAAEHGVDVRAVRRMLERGRAVLLFDGFDELALRVTYDRAAEHLATILSAVSGRAKVVLTSRTQHFATDDQWRTAMGEQVRLLAASRQIRLADFDEDQIREFLVRLFARQLTLTATDKLDPDLGATKPRAEAERRANARLVLINKIRDLSGLSANPRLLSFIAELDEDELLGARALDGAISSADLYEKLVGRWLRYEADRRRPTRGSYQSLDVKQLRQAVDALAVRLWEGNDEATDLAGLGEAVRDTLTDLSAAKLDAEQATFVVGSGSLLVRGEDDRFSFVHRSVMEYLVASVAATEFDGSAVAPSLLNRREMSDLMAEFLRGRVPRQVVAHWATEVLTSTNAPPMERDNALRLARRMDLKIVGARLAGRDLRGQDLSGRTLRFADLSRANLSGLRLRSPDLTGADLTGADLTGAVLHDADLTDACLIDADLTGARLVRPELANARLDGSRWHRAALLGMPAEGLPDALKQATVVGHDPAEPMLLPPATSVSALAFSPDGTLLAVSSGEGILLLDGQNLRPIRVLSGHRAAVLTLDFSPDGQLLASGSNDGTARLWDVRNGRQSVEFTGHTGAVFAVAFSPDGRTLATGDGSGSGTVFGAMVRLWDVRSGRQSAEFTGHFGAVFAVAFSPDGRTLATGGDDGSGLGAMVRLCDVRTGRQSVEFTGHFGAVFAVAFSPDGRTLATGDGSGSGTVFGAMVRLWDVRTGRQSVEVTGHTGAVFAVAFSPDGRTLATGDGSGSGSGTVFGAMVRLWDVRSGRQIAELTGRFGAVRAVAFSPDGRTLATGGDGGGSGSGARVRLWDVRIGRQIAESIGHFGAVRAVAFSPDGRTLATDRGSGSGARVRLWDVRSGRQSAELTGPTGAVYAVAFSPDGRTLATGDGSGSGAKARLWDLRTGHQSAEFTGHFGAVRAVAFSPDGRILATGDGDGSGATVRLWDVRSGRQSAEFTGHFGAVRAVAFSPDCRILATGGGDGTLRLWDSTTGTPIATHVGFRGRGLAVLSPDGSYKLAGDPVGALWWVVGMCRFEAGELDEFDLAVRRLGLDDPIPGLAYLPPLPPSGLEMEPPALDWQPPPPDGKPKGRRWFRLGGG